MKNPSFLPFFILTGLILCGCSSPSKQPVQYKKEKAAAVPVVQPTIPDSNGIITSPAGEAVVEIAETPDFLFDKAENHFRSRYRVIFINRSLRQLDAEDKGHTFNLFVYQLTSGKTGLTLGAKDKGSNKSNSQVAKRVMGDVLSAIRQAQANRIKR
ncbi:MAG: hypothetical protein PHV34_18605 [Verrucomicrobiae bacterium]|nr:hypothetical protein [Verrucomicrobiae bacterium]